MHFLGGSRLPSEVYFCFNIINKYLKQRASMAHQKGFAHAFLIIGLVVALIGALGFVFWQNFIYKEPVVTKTEVVEVEKDDSKSENIVQEPAYSFQDAIEEIQKVVSAEGCIGSGASDDSFSFTQVSDEGKFTGKNVVNEKLTHAYMAYGCGSQGVSALLKKEGSSWMLLNEDARIYHMCKVVRGQGFPSSVVDKCYENDRSTEPARI